MRGTYLMKKIQLIFPPNDDKYKGLRSGYTSFPPPSGLEILASFIERKFPDVQIQIFDGCVQTIDEISSLLNADLIGISDWFTNHRNAIRLAKASKKYNPSSQVVLGGPNASNLARRILSRHREVDFVVHGDGEMAILGLLKGIPFQQIPNLWYRNINGEVVFSKQYCVELDSLDVFDFRHVFKSDLGKYRNYKYDECSLGLTPVPISSIRGCFKAERQGPCIYCSMPERKLRVMNPELAWRQIQHLNSLYDIRYFFETGDSFVAGDYPEKFLKAKPPGLNVFFRNYATPDSLNVENISISKELGVVEIFIGIETIDSKVLHQANKAYDTNVIENKIHLLEQKGIRVFLPFMFGLPGETYKSVRESSIFAKYLIKKYRNIQRVLFSLALPLAGTTWFSTLIRDLDLVSEYNEHGKRSLISDDDIEYERLFLLSFKRLCHVSFTEVYNAITTQISGFPKDRIGSFGGLEHRIFRLANELRL